MNEFSYEYDWNINMWIVLKNEEFEPTAKFETENECIDYIESNK